MKTATFLRKLFLGLLPLLPLFLASCLGPPEPPEEVIPQEEMVRLLTDIHKAEGYVAVKRGTHDSLMVPIEDLYGRIYEKHNITSEEFDRSLNWYVKHPEVLHPMYREVIEELSLQQVN